MRLVREFIAGENLCHCKNIRYKVTATRMSGEMCTSLGNGFSNLMFTLFMAEENGCTDIRIVVEGDDGLCSMEGKVPGIDDFKQLGLTLKMEEHEDINAASFCGLIYDELDMNNVTNPIPVLLDFGWCKAKYGTCKQSIKMGLLRCKALSMAYQYPGCPIIKNMAHAFLRLTQGCRIYEGDMNEYERSEFKQMQDELEKNGLPIKVIGTNTRFLVERKFGISIIDQLLIEKYFDELEAIEPIHHPSIDFYCTPVWRRTYCDYVRIISQGSFHDDPGLFPSLDIPYLDVIAPSGLKGNKLRKLCVPK